MQKNRDVIEHYLEQQGLVCNTQKHEQDAICNTSYYKKCLFLLVQLAATSTNLLEETGLTYHNPTT